MGNGTVKSNKDQKGLWEKEGRGAKVVKRKKKKKMARDEDTKKNISLLKFSEFLSLVCL
jgi:hypothetical protein